MLRPLAAKLSSSTRFRIQLLLPTLSPAEVTAAKS